MSTERLWTIQFAQAEFDVLQTYEFSLKRI